ncbi:M60 family metallopeptidase [Frigoribacterium sp. VKM Ac-2836]|uniref:M60 family metallopeptidase n=1 Tax=Frigoribacterium sp. VKM Ac-2836 TaxID=2739014 RepID=UPI0015647CF7|nr:M60 family metallopeptidase [Frigoribacterium sp. VKM Ac-2836]NRD25770.1 hypothetical protein [Frigoribacterium sp. VKM Ac-2836]
MYLLRTFLFGKNPLAELTRALIIGTLLLLLGLLHVRSGAEKPSGDTVVPDNPTVGIEVQPQKVVMGGESAWVQLVPDSLVVGALHVDAPAGTTIVEADADIRPIPGAIAADGRSAVWEGSLSWSDTWRVPKVRLRVDVDVAPGRVDGAVQVTDTASSAVLASGSLPVDIVEPEIVEPDVAIAIEPTLLAAGAVSDYIRVVPESKVLGVLSITAPPGTTIVEATADTRPIDGVITPDGSSATWRGNNTWSSGWRVAKVRLRAHADAVPGRVDGAVRITETGGTRVLAAGSLPVDLVGRVEVTVPALRSGATSDPISVHVRSDARGALRVVAPTGMAITDAGVHGAAVTPHISADRASVTWPEGDTPWSSPSHEAWFRLQAVERQAGVRHPGDARVVDGGDRVLAHGAFAAVDAGPRPASIVVSADRSSTTVRVYGIGSAAAERAREGRALRHSDLQPTGRFVRKGDRVAIDVPPGAPMMSVRLGLYGAYQNVAATSLSSPVPTPSGTTTTVVADRDGMVFLTGTAKADSAVVTVRGGQPVPTFVLGQTTDDEFREQLVALPDVPIVELVAGRVFGDFQRRTADSFPTDLEARLQSWDDVVVITNGMHNLHDDLTGNAGKAPHRIYIASPDSGAGYASATQERVTFQIDTGAARNLFADDVSDQWGLWHEIGHTYQTPAYTWNGQGEVSVNISALEVQQKIGAGNRLDRQQRVINAFFAKPVGERTYGGSDLFVRVLMYDQLRRAFGDQFYPRLNQELRDAEARGELDLSTSQAKIDAFASHAATLADRDLRPFFQEWGLPIGPDAAAEMAERPGLEHEIWKNIDTGQNRVEVILPAVGASEAR